MKTKLIAGMLLGVLLFVGVGIVVYAGNAFARYTNDAVDAIDTTTADDEGNSLPLTQTLPRIKFRGVWGEEESNETSGSLGGFLIRRDCMVVLKGVWNTMDNLTKGVVAGVMKSGFFNGKIILQNHTTYRIVGLYHYNAQDHLLQFRWMTRQQTGWSRCHVIIP